jgi:hypothetical protein
VRGGGAEACRQRWQRGDRRPRALPSHAAAYRRRVSGVDFSLMLRSALPGQDDDEAGHGGGGALHLEDDSPTPRLGPTALRPPRTPSRHQGVSVAPHQQQQLQHALQPLQLQHQPRTPSSSAGGLRVRTFSNGNLFRLSRASSVPSFEDLEAYSDQHSVTTITAEFARAYLQARKLLKSGAVKFPVVRSANGTIVDCGNVYQWKKGVASRVASGELICTVVTFVRNVNYDPADPSSALFTEHAIKVCILKSGACLARPALLLTMRRHADRSAACCYRALRGLVQGRAATAQVGAVAGGTEGEAGGSSSNGGGGGGGGGDGGAGAIGHSSSSSVLPLVAAESSAQGVRRSMEDETVILLDMNAVLEDDPSAIGLEQSAAYFGVFDGHAGVSAAHFS